MQSKILPRVNFAIALALSLFVSVCCACFSLGVADMEEYNTRFPSASAVDGDFNTTKITMSDMVGTDEIDLENDKSQLVAAVSVGAYRAIAVEAASQTSKVSEFALYLYYEGDADATINYGIYVSSSLPGDETSKYTVADVSGVTEVYDASAIYTPSVYDEFVTTGSVTLSKGWVSFLKTLDSTVTLNDGDYFVVVFLENNDYNIQSVSSETDENSGETTYSYTFERYTSNDVSFSFDKTLLYVTE